MSKNPCRRLRRYSAALKSSHARGSLYGVVSYSINHVTSYFIRRVTCKETSSPNRGRLLAIDQINRFMIKDSCMSSGVSANLCQEHVIIGPGCTRKQQLGTRIGTSDIVGYHLRLFLACPTIPVETQKHRSTLNHYHPLVSGAIVFLALLSASRCWSSTDVDCLDGRSASGLDIQ